jgi:hypothetical protein
VNVRSLVGALAGALSWSGLALAAPAPAATPLELARALEQAWAARDVAAYAALWRFTAREAEEAERAFAAAQMAAAGSTLHVSPGRAGTAARAVLAAQAAFIREPRGRVEQWVFTAEEGADGWRVVSRQLVGQIDGLVHLSLDDKAYRADGLAVRLPDFELRMERGALFSAPPELGPTVLVFVGEGRVRVSPQPPTEREQLRQFCGRPVLEARVRQAFIRLHPADLHRVLAPARLEPLADGARWAPAAQRIYREQATRSFVLDAPVPGSPWWLLPSLGDALVTFVADGKGTLTYALSTGEPEDVTLFDRARRLQVLLYSSAGGPARYDEDDGRAYHIVHHDLSVRFEPERLRLEGEDTIRVRLLGGASTLRLRLHDDLQVRSVRSAQVGEHLFFRVRNQDSLMVSLGPLAGRTEEFDLTVRYGGVHSPKPLEHELLQLPEPEAPDAGYVLEDSLVYSNQTAWYPRAPTDLYSRGTFRLDVPEPWRAVTGGARVDERSADGRHQSAYLLDRPGRYFSVVLARLTEVGQAEVGAVRLRAFGQNRTRDDAARLLEAARDVLGFYQALYGPCPYPELNLVALEGRIPGGHSPPAMVIVSARPPFLREALRDDPASLQDVQNFFFAHELAHQWWGHGVAGQNYHERWLSEGTSQYAAALWARHRHGERVFQEVLARFARWALRKSADGPIHLGQRLGHLRADPQVFRAVVYNKGAYVLHMLRSLVGDEPFFEALRTFQATQRFAKAGSDDLRVALEQASGRTLSPYFDEWVLGTTLPELVVSHRVTSASASFRTVVEVAATGLPGPVPLALTVAHGQGEVTEIVNLPPGGGRFVIETPARPTRIQANAARALLARVRH